MAAFAIAVGVPPTAGVGGARRRVRRRSARDPSAFPRTGSPGATRSRSRPGRVRDRGRGVRSSIPNTSSIASTTIACSSRFFAEANSASALARSSSGSPERGAEPASGVDRTASPRLDTSSSGEAPTRTEGVGSIGGDERERVRIDRTQSMREAHGIQRPSRFDLHRAGEHHLAHRALADPLDRRGHHRLVSVGRRHGGHLRRRERFRRGATRRTQRGEGSNVAVARDQLDQPRLTGCRFCVRGASAPASRPVRVR